MIKILSMVCSLLVVNFCFAQSPLIPYRDGVKWGYADTTGKIVIAPQYDRADVFYYGEYKSELKRPVATVVTKEQIMAIDRNGKILVPGGYESIETSFLTNGIFFIVENAKGKKGLFANGKEIAPCVYDYVTPYPNDSYLLQKGEKVGLINSQGKLVVPVEYDEINQDETSNKQTFAWKAEKGKTSKNFSDNIIPVSPYLPELAEDFSQPGNTEERAVKLEKQLDLDSVIIKGNMIFLYKKGKVGVKINDKDDAPPLFFGDNYWVQDAEYIGHHMFDKQKFKSKALIIAKNANAKTGIITETGNIVLPFEYSEIIPNGSYLILKKDSKTGLLVLNTPYPFIPAVYDELHDYYSMPVKDNWSFGLFYISKNGKEGYVGENGLEFFRN